MSKEVIEALRKQAGEIAKEGHFGWGNTMTAAADALDTLLAERDALKAENKRLDLAVAQADHNYDMDRNRMMYLLRAAHDCLEQWNLKYPRLAKRGEEFSSEHTYRQIRAFVPEYREADAALQGEQP
ncbi:hypothetical protein [Stutzerimonas nitrititolerans]|uniref:hypothetical protein n=1 Tax=Stutzerimonas nitrititolerans TaxID=2482751 RepID=UPI0028A1D836|nr:hypothetical protein [Stutzerimonas nitrititolerans]